MNTRYHWCLLLLLHFILGGCATSLRKTAEDGHFHVGVAVDVDILKDEKIRELVKNEFNQIVAEYEMKFDAMEPIEGTYSFSAADALHQFAAKNKMRLFGHCLVWHEALPKWFQREKPSKERASQLLRNFIGTIGKHFRNKVYGWDVLNEAILDDGNYRKTPWFEALGPEYIPFIFRLAREADPHALLFYNDYGIEEKNAKSDAVFKMVTDLKRKGVPINGVVFQAHMSLGANLESIKENLQRFSNAGLKIRISEMDVRIKDAPGDWEEKLEKQAKLYGGVATLCRKNPDCESFNIWGVTDDRKGNLECSARDSRLIFADGLKKKLSYHRLVEAIRVTPP